jgi:hypothetical protein
MPQAAELPMPARHLCRGSPPLHWHKGLCPRCVFTATVASVCSALAEHARGLRVAGTRLAPARSTNCRHDTAGNDHACVATPGASRTFCQLLRAHARRGESGSFASTRRCGRPHARSFRKVHTVRARNGEAALSSRATRKEKSAATAANGRRRRKRSARRSACTPKRR